MRRLAGVLLVVTALCGVSAAAAAGATLTVTRTDDPDPAPACTPADCSLRAAIVAANGDGAEDVVVLAAGTYVLAAGPLPNLTSDLLLRGAGSSRTSVTGGVATGPTTGLRAGALVATADLAIQGVTFSGNRATSTNPATDTITSGAGAIAVSGGSLVLIDVVVSDNELAGRSVTGAGGVLVTSSTLSMRASSVTGNVASAQSVTLAGGLIVNASASARIEASLIADNRLAATTVVGAGGLVSNVTPATIVNTTITGNRADAAAGSVVIAGGLFSNVSDLALRQATIADNDATGPGASAANVQANAGGTRTIGGTIVAAGAGATLPSCSGALTSLGGNVETGASCGLVGPGDLPSTDPLLGPLADGGGPTMTRALPATSPALGIVPLAVCEGSDQRGIARPQGVGCDAGAFELGVPTNVSLPTLGGTAAVGQPLTCAPGTWRDGPTFAFAWLRDGAPIAGATGVQYVLAATDASAAVQCQVTATNVIGSATAVSQPVGVDALPVPTATSAPAVAGTGRRGLVVTCTNGVWASASSFAFAWLRNGVPIAGATATSLQLGARDVGRAVQCRVTATGPGGSAVADSAPVVGAGACIVPRLRGATLAQARTRLARAGCAVGRVTTVVSRAVGSGRVLRSTPAAGANRALGAKVRLTLARRP